MYTIETKISDLKRLTYLQPVCAGGPPSQYWTHHLTGQAYLHPAMENHYASGEKWLRRLGWHWMVGSETNWSPVGPDGSPDAVDPSACLMWDKAGEEKSAESTAEKTCPDNCTLLQRLRCSFDISKSRQCTFSQYWSHQNRVPSCPMSRFLATEAGFIHHRSKTYEVVSTWHSFLHNIKLTFKIMVYWSRLCLYCRPTATWLTWNLCWHLLMSAQHFQSHLHPHPSITM